MNHKDGEGRRVKTADRVFDILRVIKNQDGAGVTDIAEELDLAKSTVHQYLYTLKDREYIVKRGSRYDISLKFFEYGRFVRGRYKVLTVAEPTLQQLASETGEVAWLIVEEQGYAIYLSNELGEQAVQTHAEVGKREYIHCLASGKAMLAYMSEDRLYEIIERHGLPKKTDDTITDPETLFKNLDEIRDRGYSFNREEAASRVTAIAAPILDDDDSVLGSICVSGPSRRIRKKESQMDIPELVVEAADEIELKLTWE